MSSHLIAVVGVIYAVISIDRFLRSSPETGIVYAASGSGGWRNKVPEGVYLRFGHERLGPLTTPVEQPIHPAH
jgi:hypothetical protein